MLHKASNYGIISIPERSLMQFEFDPEKSRENKQKHGIDFIEAQTLWDDEFLIEGKARSDTEPRYVAIGVIDEKHYSAFITYRGDTIRIISVRRSREGEREAYESRRTR